MNRSDAAKERWKSSQYRQKVIASLKLYFNKNKKRYIPERTLCMCGCGEIINKYDLRGRERKFLKGHQSKVQSLETRKKRSDILKHDWQINYTARLEGIRKAFS